MFGFIVMRRLAVAATLCMAGLAPVAQAAPLTAAPRVAMQEADDPAAGMFLDVGNPTAGDSIHVGKMMIEGIAFDRVADQWAGIDHVDIFLDDRDAGGLLIGSGSMGAPNTVTEDPALSDAGWTAQVTIPRNMVGQRTMFVYALSAVTGGELVVAIPVRIVP